MDLPNRITIITLLMTYLSRGTSENMELEFLSKLVHKVHGESPLETMLILQHNQAWDCALRNWNRPETPTLRLNQLEVVKVRNQFNHKTLGLVCICKDSDTELLHNMASNFDRMRDERIILWLQVKLTPKMLRVICNLVEEHHFVQMLILEVRVRPKRTIIVRRLDRFPSPHFERIGDVFALEGPIFNLNIVNYKGMAIKVMPNWEASTKANVQMSPKAVVPITRVQDLGVLQFIEGQNLTLKVLPDPKNVTVGPSELPDIQLSTQVHLTMSGLKNWNPYDMAALMVIVPCGKDKSIDEMIRQLDVQSWLVYVMSVYGIFVLAETFIIMVTYRMSGKVYRLTSLKPVLNLRAFRAILGMSFPINRRSSLSLRQLFLAISVFGFVFSSFFNCKMSALLTHYGKHPQVQTFADLRDSGLPVIIGPTFRPFFRTEAGLHFLVENLTNVKYMDQRTRFGMLTSLNDSNAYLIYSDYWEVTEKYQEIYGRKVFCKSEYLTIIQSLPMTYILPNNSVLEVGLFRYMLRFQETGFPIHWMNQYPYILKKQFNQPALANKNRNIRPLTVFHFKLVWCILGCGYGIAIIVFMLEISLGGRKKRPGRVIAV